MTYLTLDDLYTVITEEILQDVIEADETILDKAELASIGEMTGYLNVRYDATKCFDANAKIPIVTQMLADICLYHAHARVMPDNIPTLRENRYNNAITWCEKVADGFIAPELPIKENQPTGPLRYGNSNPKTNQYF